MVSIENRLRGCIYGQAVGDALGLGTEFMLASDISKFYPNGFNSYSQIIQDRHRKRFHIGKWTDDTDMMLCILREVVSNSYIDIYAVARNFKQWADNKPIGIGRHTYEVLSLFDYLQNPFRASEIIWELSGRESAANGGIMRTSAVGVLKHNVDEYAEDVCKLTHSDPRCVKSCVLVSLLISNLIWKGEELNIDQVLNYSRYDKEMNEYIVRSISSSNISDLELDDPKFCGYTYKTMSAALWALWHCSSFEEGLLSVVNAGGDADTNASVACSILGAKFGYDSIPDQYIKGLIGKEMLDSIYTQLVSRLIG